MRAVLIKYYIIAVTALALCLSGNALKAQDPYPRMFYLGISNHGLNRFDDDLKEYYFSLNVQHLDSLDFKTMSDISVKTDMGTIDFEGTVSKDNIPKYLFGKIASPLEAGKFLIEAATAVIDGKTYDIFEQIETDFFEPVPMEKAESAPSNCPIKTLGFKTETGTYAGREEGDLIYNTIATAEGDKDFPALVKLEYFFGNPENLGKKTQVVVSTIQQPDVFSPTSECLLYEIITDVVVIE
ncbi:MAG: hypothetical protein LBF41_06565 [Deltaproteobacteria bacterium]|jgi:hypothetical protein|nr:hypothetical protein [Deltaproteobacteria bacterium]